MPAEYILNKIRYIESMNMPRLLVLKSGTGSGKSTAFPDYLFKNTDKTLLISVPLISISEELPQTFQQHLGYKIGENIGAINSQTNTLPEDKKK
jgi:HrpA-like RNA helicase